LDIDDSDPSGLFITGVSVTSIFGEWNERNLDSPILPGDVLRKVNGITGEPVRMVSEMQRKNNLALVLLRSSEYRVARMLDAVADRAAREGLQERARLAAERAARAVEEKAAEEGAKSDVNAQLRSALGFSAKGVQMQSKPLTENGTPRSVESAWSPTAEFDLMNFVDQSEANLEAIQLFLAQGKDPNKTYVGGVTALHVAAMRGNGDVVEILTEAGANTNLADDMGQTPIFFASTRSVCKALKRHRARLEVKNKNGQTAAHLAARNGFAFVLHWLADQMELHCFWSIDNFGAGWPYYAHLAGIEEVKVSTIKARSGLK